MIGKFIKATATYDKANKRVYATVNGAMPFPFSKGDDVLAILDRSSFLARVEAFETMGDGATVELLFDSGFDFLWNSGSEKQVLLKGLSNSKPLERPSLLIDVAAVPNAVVLSALKEQIALGTITFAQAVEMAGLNSSSQVTTIFNSGNPNTTVETYVADKVKAKFSTKGLQILSDRTKMGQVITSGQPAKKALFLDYLLTMRQELREQREEFGVVLLYTATVVDENLNVVLNKKQIKEVLKFKNIEEIGYRLKFEDEFNAQFSGTYTVLIEKKIVKNTDYIGWTGSSGIPDPSSLGLWNQEGPLEVEYLKKYDDNNPRLELAGISSRFNFDLNVLFHVLASFTVDDKTIYGNIKLTEDNKVQFTKPKEMGQVAWAKGIAAFKSSGTGILTSLEQGYPAKDETLQLKVDLVNLENAFEFFRQLQVAPTSSVPQLLSSIGTLKVTDAEISPAKAGVNTLTGIATLATGTVKWFNDAKYFEITVKNNSKETFINVFNSNGADEGFQEVNAGLFLDAVVADITKNYEEVSQSILRTRDRRVNILWTADFQVNGESYQMAIQNAEVKRITSGRIYRLVYDVGIPEQLIRFVNHDDLVVILTRTESLRAG